MSAGPASTDSFTALAVVLLRSGRRVRFQAAGTSMRPAILANEVVTIEPCVRPDHVRVGDIVLYRQGARLLAHRVVAMRRQRGGDPRLLLRGDGMSACDAPIGPDQVLGRVIAVRRAGRDIRLTGRPAVWRWRLRAGLQAIRRRHPAVRIVLSRWWPSLAVKTSPDGPPERRTLRDRVTRPPFPRTGAGFAAD